MNSSLRNRTISALIWAIVGRFGSQAIHYIALLVLAWLLSPSDFGLVGMAMLFINFTVVVGELGLVQVIVQRANAEEPMLSTAFWTNLLVSLLLAGGTYAGAERISVFLGDSRAAAMLQALSIIFPATAMAVVPNALLMRNLEFKCLARRELVSQMAFIFGGLLLALIGAGPWSLVGGIIAQRVTKSATLWTAIPWRPALQFDLQSLRHLLRFGFYVMASVVFHKGFVNVDYFIVGKWIGTEALGYYTLAYQLAAVPLRNMTGVLHEVAFPAFSIIQSDLVRLKASFRESIQYIFSALVPIGLLLIVLAPYFLEIVYGPKWIPAAVPLQFLTVAGLLYGFDIAGSVFLAVGRPEYRFWIMALRMVLFVAFVAVFGLSLGIGGVAMSYALSVGGSALISLGVVSRVVAATWSELLKPLWPAGRTAIFVSFIVVGANLLFPPNVRSSWVFVIGLATVMAAIFAMTLLPRYLPGLKRLISVGLATRMDKGD